MNLEKKIYEALAKAAEEVGKTKHQGTGAMYGNMFTYFADHLRSLASSVEEEAETVSPIDPNPFLQVHAKGSSASTHEKLE